MPWYTGLSTPECSAFTNWAFQKDQQAGDVSKPRQRKINFFTCVSVALNDKPGFNGIAPFQSKLLHGRLVDILWTFNRAGGYYWGTRALASTNLNNVTDSLGAPPPQRSAVLFEAAGSIFVGPINQTRTNAVKIELGNLRDGLEPDIDDLFDDYCTEATVGASALTIKNLADLRAHQRMKLDGQRIFGKVVRGGHLQGNFHLQSKAIDGLPLLLVSKGDKDISSKYLDMSNANRMVGSAVTTGTYAQGNHSITFTRTGGDTTASQGLFTSALQALKTTSLQTVNVA